MSKKLQCFYGSSRTFAIGYRLMSYKVQTCQRQLMLKGQLTPFTTHLGALQHRTPLPVQTLPLTLHPPRLPPLPKPLEAPLPIHPLLNLKG